MSFKYTGEISLTQIFNLTKSALSGKVDKVIGKGLSTNDYTNEDKNGLQSIVQTSNILANAEVIDS